MVGFMTALLAAISIQDKAEQYGAYAGIAAVFGLGVLSLLYFAQAREVKRLREWAGRAPERAAELEARAVAAAEEKLAAPAAAPVATPVPAAATAAAVAAAMGLGAATGGWIGGWRRAASAWAIARSSTSRARSGARPAHSRRRLTSRACAK